MVSLCIDSAVTLQTTKENLKAEKGKKSLWHNKLFATLLDANVKFGQSIAF